MEGLRKRVMVLGAAFIVAGLAFQAVAHTKGISRTESWMEQKAPKELPGYDMVPNLKGDNPEVSYVSDESVYKVLTPYGIVARIFREKQGVKMFDVNVIASSTKDSFHDPRVCFSAQRWTLEKETRAMVKTQTRGEVPVTLAEMSHRDHGRHPAVFFYRGPDGFTSSTSGLKIQMLKHQFLTMKDQEGVFYRIIALTPNTTTDELLEFTGAWLDEANKTSDGFF